MAARKLRFDLGPGDLIADKYRVVERLGSGWEGEVYKVRERGTRIARAAKLFYPSRNPRGSSSRFYARKLHKLRHCPILIQYLIEERVEWQGVEATMLLSDLVEGELLSAFMTRCPGRRLRAYEAFHLLHALACGVEPIHAAGEYHGDLHSDNVIVVRFGLQVQLRLIDMFRRNGSPAQNRRDDLCDLVYLFWEALGGQRHYARHAQPVKHICCGLKRTLILRKFPTVSHLRRHLEEIAWR